MVLPLLKRKVDCRITIEINKYLKVAYRSTRKCARLYGIGSGANTTEVHDHSYMNAKHATDYPPRCIKHSATGVIALHRRSAHATTNKFDYSDLRRLSRRNENEISILTWFQSY